MEGEEWRWGVDVGSGGGRIALSSCEGCVGMEEWNICIIHIHTNNHSPH